MLSYLIYSTYFMIACALSGNSKQRHNKYWNYFFIIFTFGLMLFMMACRRPDVGNDTQAYVTFFRKMGAGNINYDRRVEICFRYLTVFLSHITNNEQIYLAICVILAFIPYLAFLVKTSDNLEFSIAMFWLNGCIVITSASRQGIAMGIILLGYLYLRTEKPGAVLIYSLLCILASLFHTAAIVMIIMPIFRKKKITARTMLIITLLTLGLTATNLVSFVFSRFVGNYYILYSDVQSGWAAAMFNMLLGVVAYVIEYYSLSYEERRYFLTKDEKNIQEENTLQIRNETYFFRWATIFSVACCILSVNSSVMGREASYFQPFLIVYLSNHIGKIKYSRYIMVGILLARIGYSALALVIRPEWNSFFPFYYFWQ